jgi:hypothetical protein
MEAKPPPQPGPVVGFVGEPLNQYGAMTLKDFHDQVWWPHRESTVADSTQQKEAHHWKAILAELGGRSGSATWTL